MKVSIERTISDKHLIELIIDICNLPENYTFHTINCEVNLKIRAGEDRLLAKALLQEELRKRLSSPQRIKFNQTIIKQRKKIDFK